MQDKNMSNANTISLTKPEGETRYMEERKKKKYLKQVSYEVVRTDSSAAGQRPVLVNTTYRKVCGHLKGAQVLDSSPSHCSPHHEHGSLYLRVFAILSYKKDVSVALLLIYMLTTADRTRPM
jgi:hypothetical protein